MNVKNDKSIRFPSLTNDKLEKTAVKLGRNKVMVIIQMVDYFYRTGKDRLDAGDELLRKTLTKSHDTYTSFIKVQERDLLIPMLGEVKRMIANQEKLNVLLSRIDQTGKALQVGQDGLVARDAENSNLLRTLHAHLQSKIMLKDQFLYLLNSYVRERESMNSFSSTEAKKAQLLEKTVNVIKQL